MERRRLVGVKFMSPVTVAYLAGIIDGEGCIGVGWRKKGNSKLGDTAKYITPTLQISNTNTNLLNWIQYRVGGGIYTSTSKRIDNRKQIFRWSIAGNRALDVIEAVRPYLIVKNDQADVVMSIPRYKASRNAITGRMTTAMTIEDFEANDRIAAEIRRLNYRGREDQYASW